MGVAAEIRRQLETATLICVDLYELRGVTAVSQDVVQQSMVSETGAGCRSNDHDDVVVPNNGKSDNCFSRLRRGASLLLIVIITIKVY